MARICPSCQKPLLSGFSPRCNHCEAKLPAQLLFTQEKKAAIEAGELCAKRALLAMEEERKQKAAASRRRLTRIEGDIASVILSVGSTLGKK